MSLLCHSCPTELWVTTQSQGNQLDTERGCISVCVLVSEWVSEREGDNLYYQLITFSHRLLRPSGLKLKGQVLSAHTHTHAHTHRYIETLAHANTESQTERVSLGELEQWSECRVRWHTTAVADWLISISITQPSDIAVHTLGHTHTLTERQTHTTTLTRTGPARTHTLYPLNSHQPLLWAVHRWLQTESKKDRER